MSPGNVRTIRIVLMVCTFSCIFTCFTSDKEVRHIELGLELQLNTYKNVRISVPRSPFSYFTNS